MGSISNPTQDQEASDVLTTHWHNGTTIAELPSHLKPTSIEQGYKIQSYIERFTSSPLWGWKIAATSVHGQHHINVDRPLAGRILAERVTTALNGSGSGSGSDNDKKSDKVPLGPNRMSVAELEFAFRVGRDIAPKWDGASSSSSSSSSSAEEWETHQVMDALDGLFLGSEIPDSRYEDFVSVGAAQLIADNACADRYVLGPEVQGDWKGRNLVDHVVRGWIEGHEDQVFEGRGGNVLGDPRVAMTWIANELGRYGVTLKKGQYVTTGTCIVPVPVKPGDKLIGDYGDMGKIEIEFVQ